MQLVAYGSQDVYLTAEPTITFWKAVYRRHTNFAIEAIEQTLSGNATFGSKVVCRIGRNGDLISNTYLLVTMPDITDTDNYYVNRVGFNLMKEVELRIGGQMIDRMYSTWKHIWTELTHTKDKKDLLDKMVGTYNNGINSRQTNPGRLYIPLLFAYCRHPALALPLIALQYHEVEIHITFETLNNCLYDRNINNNVINVELSNVSLLIDYIFLDTEERKEFAQKPHEYLIEIVQSQTSSVSYTGTTSTRLTFNHPTKFISWVMRDPYMIQCQNYIQISAGTSSVLAIKDDGTLWGWGTNANGELGLPITINNTNSPKQIGTATNWAQVKTCGIHSIAIKNDGTLWGTGWNFYGQLGLGDTWFTQGIQSFYGFVQIGNDNNWSYISCGKYYTMVIKTDGTLWAFGLNSDGQLGLNDTTNRYYPTQVGTDLWNTIACSIELNSYTIGIKTNGSIWGWGYNIYGNLGLNDVNPRAVPTQIGTETSWYAVSCGGYHTLALKNNGSLWGWGNNLGGQLGQGDNQQQYNIPTRIGTDINWTQIGAGSTHSIAMKTNNTIYSWGENQYGQLGNGTTTNTNTPNIIIGTWTKFSAGSLFTLLLNTSNNIYGSGYNDNGELGLGYSSNYLTTFTPIQCDDSDIFTGFGSYDYNVSSTAKATLKLNGQDRFSNRDSTFFNYIQPYQHFSGNPEVGINVYSFAVKPEELQPSGTCNFSRIDNVNLDITPTTNSNNTTKTNLELLVYGFSYNILRVASGMAGLAFSN